MRGMVGGRKIFDEFAKSKSLQAFIYSGMGTKLEHNPNIFAPFLKNGLDLLPVGFNTPYIQFSLNNKLLKASVSSVLGRFQAPMDTLLDSHTESLRKMMMKQEEIFKQQVRELHRLYKVQQRLMAELRTNEAKLQSFGNVNPQNFIDTRDKFSSTSHTSLSSCISIRYPTTAHLSPENIFLQLHNARTDPSSRELSIHSKDPLGEQKGFDLEWSLVHDNATEAKYPTTHLKVKTEMEDSELYCDGESDIELTLSIGCGADKKKSKNSLHSDMGCSTSASSETEQLLSTAPVRMDGRDESSDPFASFSGHKIGMGHR